MASVANANGKRRTARQPLEINPVAVTVGVAAATLLLSLFILQGQTNALIDATRSELAAKIDANQTATTAKIDANQTATTAKIDANQTATTERLDRVLLALVAIGDVADDIEALRDAVDKLANP